MPVVVELFGFKIKVNAKDHVPPHVHVEGNGCNGRYNIKTMTWMDANGFSPKDRAKIETEIKSHIDEIWAEWRTHHAERK